jgi:hypothetical protein
MPFLVQANPYLCKGGGRAWFRHRRKRSNWTVPFLQDGVHPSGSAFVSIHPIHKLIIQTMNNTTY